MNRSSNSRRRSANSEELFGRTNPLVFLKHKPPPHHWIKIQVASMVLVWLLNASIA